MSTNNYLLATKTCTLCCFHQERNNTANVLLKSHEHMHICIYIYIYISREESFFQNCLRIERTFHVTRILEHLKDLSKAEFKTVMRVKWKQKLEINNLDFIKEVRQEIRVVNECAPVQSKPNVVIEEFSISQSTCLSKVH